MKRLLLLLLLLIVPAGLQAAILPQEVKTPLGITAWLQEDESLPVVSIAFAWKGGFEEDPDNRQGLSMLASNMLTHGAGTYDDNAFQKALQENAISLDFDARRDAFRGSLRSLKETLPQAAKLLRASITAPRFDAATLERQKAHQISSLKFNLADPDWLLLRLAMREAFKGHAYATRAYGTEASIKAMTVEDLRNWQKHLARGNLVVTATGAITPVELSNLLDDVFGSLPEKPVDVDVPEAGWPAGGKSFLLKMPGPQAQLLMAWPGLKRKDRDWYAAEVLDYILGGGSFSSRLMKEIREKRGLTYGASSSLSPLDHAAMFTAQASFEGKNAAEVLKLAQAEVDKMKDTPVSAEELQAAKDYLIGSAPLELTSTSSIAAHFLNLRLQGLAIYEDERRAKAIQAVTAADVQRVAKQIFGKPPALFWVGSPEGITAETFDKLD
ncbi:MAG TPA: pitrilysin family protein [Alphaproteobacteria bacterium]|nr:pitrilysin family protein [Alphaproteobacteria bacterium]